MKKLKCPICGHEASKFDKFTGEYYILGELKDHFTRNAICPSCRSDMRHRFIYKFLLEKTNFSTSPLRMIHFAPEKWLSKKICCMDNIDYTPVDISPIDFDFLNVQHADINQLPFEDESFDALIMIHVLEHIRDDTKAIQEMYRVLKPGGWAVIAVPTIEGETHSDLTLSADRREKMYGIDEHFRLYGTDLVKKLDTAGLNTELFEFSDIDCDFADLDQSSPHIDSDKYIFYSKKYQVSAPMDARDVCVKPDINNNNTVKTRTQPRLSVITVTYNADLVLEKTLLSLFCQTFHDYELIVIDGNSTDNTVDIIKEYSNKITYWISEEDKGIYDAMNKGLSIATGEYIQFLNAGDYYSDNHVLQDIFSSLESKPVLIYGDINILDTNGKIIYQKAGSFTLEDLQKRGTGVLCHQAMFVLKDSAPKYNSKYKYKAELNWYFDILEIDNFTSMHLQRPIVYYSLGGFGYKHFLHNRLEWILLIYHRFGINTVIKSRIIFFLLKNSLSRYSIPYNPVKLLNRVGSILKRTIH